jgi:proteasome component ECM29
MQETPEQAAQRRQAEGSESSTDVAAPSASSEEGNVGGAAGVSEASLGAYREMASAAVASGRPDILYSMLILSVSHPIWSSTQKRRDAYGSSTLLGGAINQDDVKTALTPYLSRLLPRILRAMHE